MTVRSRRAGPAKRIAVFITPHGFGHAARAAAIMEALTAIAPSIQFDIFTTVPPWFFAQSNSFAFTYHDLLADIGLIQKTPFQADLPATVQQLRQLMPFDPVQIKTLAKQLRRLNCAVVICDIAAMGIRVAQKAGVPSILVENFTWDWLYQGYDDKGLNEFNRYLKSIFAEADVHIQTQPVCNVAAAQLEAAPVSRKIQMSGVSIRRKLGISPNDRVVMITAGGVTKDYGFIDKLSSAPDIQFIVPGAAATEIIKKNLVLLPENSDYFHPDLINAVDAVVGKVGYSTIAEIYQTGVPFGYVARPENREMKSLVGFIENHLGGMPIKESDFHNGAFTKDLTELLRIPRARNKKPNGADQIAGFVASLLN